MVSLLWQIVSFLTLLSSLFHQHEAANTLLAAPIRKHVDAAKPLYSIQIILQNTDAPYIYMYRNFLIDLDAPHIWHECVLKDTLFHGFYCPYGDILCTYPVYCDQDLCGEFQTTYAYHNSSCPSIAEAKRSTDLGGCTCPVNVRDPVTGSCGIANINYDHFTMNRTQGRNYLADDLYNAWPYGACIDPSSFKSFPKDVIGVMALSSSPYALSGIVSVGQVKRIIAICLPSTLSAPGVLFSGKGPYYLLPQSHVDVRMYLSYTPLLGTPGANTSSPLQAGLSHSFGYFIGVNSIVIKKRSIDFPANTTAKLSTTDPYTILRTDIYNSVARRFSKVTKRIPPAKAIAPFGLCFKASVGDPKGNLRVPNINFSLKGGKNWAMSTANTMKQVTKDVACLAFVDGGVNNEHAIVIGTFQLEDNFVVFDLENSLFGFSSSLLCRHTSCSNFNSTLIN